MPAERHEPTRNLSQCSAGRTSEAPNLVVRSTRELEQAAERNWLARYADQDFSFIDAVSFAVMADRRIRDALTLDRHFAVAGFSISPPGIE